MCNNLEVDHVFMDFRLNGSRYIRNSATNPMLVAELMWKYM